MVNMHHELYLSTYVILFLGFIMQHANTLQTATLEKKSLEKQYLTTKRLALPLAIAGIIAGGSLLGAPAFADTAKQPVADLGETVIVGHRDEQKTLYSEELLSRPNASLGAVLGDNMGVNVDTFGAAATRPIVRGQRGERVTVLSAGSPQMDASAASPDHAITTDTLTSSKIEILRGVQALAHGANVTTGVVNVQHDGILLDKPNQDFGGKVGAKTATVDGSAVFYTDNHLMLSDNVALTFAGSLQNKHNYDVPKHIQLAEHGEHEHEHEEGHDHDDDAHAEEAHEHEHGALQDGKAVIGTRSKEEFARVGLSYIGEQIQLGVNFEDFDKTYGLPGHAHNDCHAHDNTLHCEAHDHEGDHDDDDHEEAHDHDDDHEHEHGEAPYIKLKSQATQFKARYTPASSNIKHIQLTAKHTDYEHQELDEDVVQTTFSNQGASASVDLATQPLAGGKLTLSAGLGYSDYDFSAVGAEGYVPKTNTRSLSGYLTNSYKINPVWHIDSGLRVQSQEVERLGDGNADAKTISHDGVSAALENHITIGADTDFSVGLSYSERQPNAVELFANGAHLATNTLERGNTELDSEVTKGVELGLRKEVGDAQFDVSLYHNWIGDYIYGKTLDYKDGIRLINYSQDDAVIYGADASLSYRFNPYFTLVGFGDIVRGEFDEVADGGSKNLPRMPAPRLGAKAIVYATDAVTAEVSAYHRFEQDKLAAFETTTPSYNMVDANVRYDNLTGTDFSVYLSVSNLLNEMAYNHASYLADKVPLAGRSVQAGVELRY